MNTRPTLIGTVESVQGVRAAVRLNHALAAGLTFVEGHGYRVGQVGTFVRVPVGYVDLYAVVSEIGAAAVPEPLVELEPFGNLWMTIQLVGESLRLGAFERGISQYPTIGDEVHLATQADLAKIYGDTETIGLAAVGRLAAAEGIPALVNIDALLTRHSAVVGATGAGKSTAVAGLITSLSRPELYPSARIMVLDIHGEYAAALSERAAVFRVGPRPSSGQLPLCVPYWALTSSELVTLTLGSVDDRALGPVLDRILDAKREALHRYPRAGVTQDSLTADSPVPFSIHRLWFELHCELAATHYDTPGRSQSRDSWALETDADDRPVEPGDPLRVVVPRFRPPKNVKDDDEKIHWHQTEFPQIRRQLDGLAARLRDPRFEFLFRPGPWSPDLDGAVEADLDTLLAGWVGGPSPVTVLDLSGIPAAVLSDLIGAVVRIVYEALFWGRYLPEGGRRRPLLLVLEEAHNYLQPGAQGPAALALRRVAREGRKYGMGAMLVTQRPAEIDPTILAQCGTVFAMRLTNGSDASRVMAAVPGGVQALAEALPILRTGEAIIVGEAVRMPARALIALPPAGRRPDSGDPVVCDRDALVGWSAPPGSSNYANLVSAWRAQDPHRSASGVPPNGDD